MTVELLADLRPERIVEIGIASGDSTALLPLVTEPKLFVAIERDSQPGAPTYAVR